jgi:oligopeptide transport system substrate-binding protein
MPPGPRRVVLLLVLSSILQWGCRDDPRPAPDVDPSPRQGGVLRLALTEPSGLDPARAEDTYQGLVIAQIFEGLVDLDANLNVVPALAKSWIVDSDGLGYHFVLRASARFQNGRVVTADDVAWSFLRAARTPGGLAREHLAHIVGGAEAMAGKAPTISGVRVNGPRALTITLVEPYAPFLNTLATAQMRIAPRESVEAAGGDFAHRPVGSGPFRLQEWRRGEKIVLAASDGYWKGRPYLDRVEIDVTPGHDDRAFESFLAGEVDLAGFGKADRQRVPPGASVVQRLEMAVTCLGLNLATPPFDDPRVRRAAALSLDREAILEASGRVGLPTRGIVPLGMVGGPPQAFAPARGADEARKVLEDAGRPGGRGLAAAQLWANGTSPPTRATARAIARDLESVGIPVREHAVSWPALVGTVDAGKAPAYLMTWVADTPDRDSFLGVLFRSHGANNYLHYADPEVDRLLTAARREMDPAVRIRLYDEVEERVGAANVLIPLFSEQSTFAVRAGLQGVAVDPMGQISLAAVYWEPPR